MRDIFWENVIGLIPDLRAYAIALTRSSIDADDLVQETLLRAGRYQRTFAPGTQLRAWLYKILRNCLYTGAIERRRLVQDVDGRLAAGLVSPPDQAWCLEFDELMAALDCLSPETREAVVLVLASGLTYEEAAEVCGCAEGTIKSRVNRGRLQLAGILDPTVRPTRRPMVFRKERLALSA